MTPKSLESGRSRSYLSSPRDFKKNANEEARDFESRGYKAAIVFKKEKVPALNRKVPYYFVYTRKG